jgi:hypothetical protein
MPMISLPRQRLFPILPKSPPRLFVRAWIAAAANGSLKSSLPKTSASISTVILIPSSSQIPIRFYFPDFSYKGSQLLYLGVFIGHHASF